MGRTAPAEALELLLRLGELEAALDDARFPERDDTDPVSHSLRAAARAGGGLFWHVSHADTVLDPAPVPIIRAQLQALRSSELPPTVELRPPEEFAYQALSPESFQEVAVDFARRWPARRFT